jgi:hypothetical protein
MEVRTHTRRPSCHIVVADLIFSLMYMLFYEGGLRKKMKKTGYVHTKKNEIWGHWLSYAILSGCVHAIKILKGLLFSTADLRVVWFERAIFSSIFFFAYNMCTSWQWALKWKHYKSTIKSKTLLKLKLMICCYCSRHTSSYLQPYSKGSRST